MNVMIFTSPTCGPCKTMKPILTDILVKNKIPFVVFDASPDTQPVFVEREVRSVPTIVCTNEGKELGRIVGAKGIAEIEEKLKEWGALK